MSKKSCTKYVCNNVPLTADDGKRLDESSFCSSDNKRTKQNDQDIDGTYVCAYFHDVR